MPQLRPFRGLRYDRTAVPALSAVICPPYDVISVAERVRLAERHPANAVHVELPTDYPTAAGLLAAWQRDRVLRLDERPFIYVYQQHYRLADGATRRARGFLCRLGLERAGEGNVLVHERTMAAPKADRYRLLDAVRANLSPVVMLYSAPDPAEIEGLLDRLTTGPSAAEAVDDAGTIHGLWPVDTSASADAARLLSVAGGGSLTIADGHHRYETSLRFCAEHPDVAAANAVMVLLYEASSGGLTLLPTHRLVDGSVPDGLLDRAREAGGFRPLSTAEEVWRALDQRTIGIWTAAGGGVLEPSTLAEGELPVAVLNEALPRLLGVERDEIERRSLLSYTHDVRAAIEAIDSGAAGVAFLLLPPSIDEVLVHAAAGRVMPQKSTYFFPKAATGLVFNLLAA